MNHTRTLPSSKNDIVRLFTALLLLGLLVVSGCSSAKKGAGAEGENGDGTGTLSDEDLALQNQERWADGAAIPNAQGDGPFQDILFDFDSSSVRSEYQPLLRDITTQLKGDSTMRVEIEGHCDNRGTNEYNMALGERRAKSVARALYDLGAPAEQLATVSYGEELPIAPGNSDEDFGKNRRAHFAVSKR